MKNLFSIGLLAIGLIACGQKQTSEFAVDTIAKAGNTSSEVSEIRDLYSDGYGKIIKAADCRFEVKKETMDAIELSVKKYGAFIASSNLELQNPMLEQRLMIRVPGDHFESLLKEFVTQAKYINYQRVTSEDVAKEFVDLESRLRTKREVEQRYTEILRHKAGTIEELLKAEQQIGELHEEIEATISRINFLREQVRYSTIKLELYQVVEQQISAVKTSSNFLQRFSTAFTSGLSGAMEILIAVVYLWPVIIIAGVAWLTMRRRKSTGVSEISQ